MNIISRTLSTTDLPRVAHRRDRLCLIWKSEFEAWRMRHFENGFDARLVTKPDGTAVLQLTKQDEETRKVHRRPDGLCVMDRMYSKGSFPKPRIPEFGSVATTELRRLDWGYELYLPRERPKPRPHRTREEIIAAKAAELKALTGPTSEAEAPAEEPTAEAAEESTPTTTVEAAPPAPGLNTVPDLAEAITAVNWHKKAMGDGLCLSVTVEGRLRGLVEYE